MDTQTSKTQHIAPTPWWRGLIILFVVCCLLFGMMSLISDKSNNPQSYKPRPRELTKEERREEKEKERKEKLQMAVDNLHLRLDQQQALASYEDKNFPGASLEASSDRWVSVKRGGKHPAIYHDQTIQEPVKEIQPVSSSASLPPANLGTELIAPFMREKLRLHDDMVRNLLN